MPVPESHRPEHRADASCADEPEAGAAESLGARFDRVRMAVSATAAPPDPVRGPRTAVIIGRLLAIAFLTCFFTGLFSHFLQDPLEWMRFPTRPAWLYQLNQGLHIASGLASVPLLLGKLWTVYPRLFTWPPVQSLIHLVERGLIGVLVAASLLQVTMGVINIYHWYAWPFSFRVTHFALAWVIVGSLLAHIAFQLPTIKQHWRRPRPPHRTRAKPDRVPKHADATTIERRLFFSSVLTGAGAIVLLTAGQSTKLLSPFNAFGPRTYGEGPQSLPVNRTAAAANVLTTALDPAWRLEVRGPGISRSFSLEDLRNLPQTEARIPIACVEGWSTSADWRGVRMRDLLDECSIDPASRLAVSSLQTRGGYASSEMGPEFASDDLTLVALELNGEVLEIDHGYPARIISPGRPGVLQTKWITRIEALR